MQDNLQNLLHSLIHETIPVGDLPLDQLSDLGSKERDDLAAQWYAIPPERRILLLTELGDREALHFDLDFSQVYFVSIQDSVPEIIRSSILSLAGIENRNALPQLLELISHDDSGVRVEAAAALGFFVYLGELDEISSDLADEVVASLLNAHRSDPDESVRAVSLESLGYSAHAEVSGLILQSLQSDVLQQSVSAMKAIGRSADSSWKPQVEKHLYSLHPEMRLESVRAAGELELKNSLKDIIDLLDDVDRKIRLASIWSLAQIGGDNVDALLTELLIDNEDIEETDLIEDALNLLEFNKGLDDMLLFDLDPENNEDDLLQ